MNPLLNAVLEGDGQPYALLHRPATAPGSIDVLTGDIVAVPRIADIPLPAPGGCGRHEVLAVLPYRQIGERGFAFPDDGAPLLALSITGQAVVGLDEVLDALPDGPIELGEGDFDSSDAQYAETVRQVLASEIGAGAGANFVIKRSFTACIGNWSRRTALAFFRRLVGKDTGCHWTFVIHTGERTFIGASPERHVSLDRGTVVMNPISGTYRYPPGGPELCGVLRFLSDTKEANELYMVLDEELKMMGRVCDRGGRVTGPHLTPMARIAHTGYLISGHSSLDARDILRETTFAPTVTGGPLESACRTISRFEPDGRGYYAGVAALIGRDAAGSAAMDSAILIRTADVGASGRMRISAGATLVRDSDPDSEAAETRAKAAGLLEALRGAGGCGGPGPAGIADHPDVDRALAERNVPLSPFWFESPAGRARPVPALAGRSILVIDAEDTFTAMARHLLGALGLQVTVRRFDQELQLDGYDLVIVGPGPGDPRDHADPKIARLRGVVGALFALGQPFLAVCLGHQVLSTVLGLQLVRNPFPNQGVQRKVDIFGRTELVGFYNTFSARSRSDRISSGAVDGTIEVARDTSTGEVYALRGPGFTSVQFHPASVLSRNGADLLAGFLGDLLTSEASLVKTDMVPH